MKHESPTHIQRSPVSASYLERRDPFPEGSVKFSRHSRHISRGGALQGKGERNSRVVPPFPEAPDVSVHSRENCFPCTASTFKPRIDSHYGGTWDRPVGKLRGKATDPLIHAKGSVTLLLQLGRKGHVHAPTRPRTDSPGETPEVPQDPCQHWRGFLRFRHRLHTRSVAPTSMGEESRESPEQLAWGLAFPEANRAGP